MIQELETWKIPKDLSLYQKLEKIYQEGQILAKEYDTYPKYLTRISGINGTYRNQTK